MFFSSDNWSGAHPEISKSLSKHAEGYSVAYGDGEIDQIVREKFNALFERDVSVHFVSTGTAANSLALTAYNKPGAVGFCHREAHIREDECGAPEYFAHGARLRIVDGKMGKMDPADLEAQIQSVKDFGVSGGTPAFVSITQCTEAGTVHSLDELIALVSVAKFHNLPVHMDGARFANAIASLDCTPAEMTWKLGIDALSFGGTKNGCWCAEALIFMNPGHAKSMPYLQKRGAQVFSKSRFVSAQFDAYLEDSLWLKLAAHSNKMAAELEAAIRRNNQIRMAWPRQANEVFAILDKQMAEKLRAEGAFFYNWPEPHSMPNLTNSKETIARFVTSFATDPEEIKAFTALLS